MNPRYEAPAVKHETQGSRSREERDQFDLSDYFNF